MRKSGKHSRLYTLRADVVVMEDDDIPVASDELVVPATLLDDSFEGVLITDSRQAGDAGCNTGGGSGVGDGGDGGVGG